jgi:hypothetical protein
VKTLSKILLSGLTAAALLTVAGCATESNRAMPVEQVASANLTALLILVLLLEVLLEVLLISCVGSRRQR